MKLSLKAGASQDLQIAFQILRDNCIIVDLDDAATFFEKPWKYAEDLEGIEYDEEIIEVDA